MNFDATTQFLLNKTSNGKTDASPLAITVIETPFGNLVAAATTKGICMLEFSIEERLTRQIIRLEKIFSASIVFDKSLFFEQLNQEIQEYFNENRESFDVPLDIRGTEFQEKTWQALQTIPYGETRSYQEQAITISQPDAIRAVANANRNNIICIIIPCHRVVGKNGKMTGYGGEIWRKEFLLQLEKDQTTQANHSS